MAMSPRSFGVTIWAKDQFYFYVSNITSNSSCEAQRVSKNLKKILKDRVRSPNQCMGDFSERFLLNKEKIMVKSHLIKSNHRVLIKILSTNLWSPCFAPDYVITVLVADMCIYHAMS